MAKRQYYWFKIVFGKWIEESFDPENSNVFVEAWDAQAAIRKALNDFEQEEGEVVVSVLFLGYPQGKIA